MKSITSNKIVARSQRAFTLIELMITVAIVAIIAAIAIPAYTSYITKSEIRAAQADLMALSLNFEGRYQRTLAYPTFTDPQKADTAGIKQVMTSWTPGNKDSNFNFKMETISASTYKIVAEGKTGTRQAGCKVSITNENKRETSGCKYITSGSWL